jgi:hypothetical protein
MAVDSKRGGQAIPPKQGMQGGGSAGAYPSGEGTAAPGYKVVKPAQSDQIPAPGVKVDSIDPTPEGPNTDIFYKAHIGRGDSCIPVGQVPDVGDYQDDDVSHPQGPLFDGPQATPSSGLNLK